MFGLLFLQFFGRTFFSGENREAFTKADLQNSNVIRKYSLILMLIRLCCQNFH